MLAALGELRPLVAMVPVSAREKDGVDRVLDEISLHLPEGPAGYDETTLTDKPTSFFVREYIREQVLIATEGEVPHAVAISIEEFSETQKLVVIKATIHVEKAGQRSILVGRGGAKIKEIGIGARKRLEEMIGRKVHLELFVRVTERWKSVPRQLAELGYDRPEGMMDKRRRRAQGAVVTPIVAIVGRPNVGKSTLFNRFAGKDLAIVHDEPGVTRDRHYTDAHLHGRDLTLVDTGGFDPSTDDPIGLGIVRHVEAAIAEADAILCILDGTAPPTSADREAVALLRRSKKPVLYAANKADDQNKAMAANELYSLGLDRVFPISAAHGRGLHELEAALVARLPAADAEDAERPTQSSRTSRFSDVRTPGNRRSSIGFAAKSARSSTIVRERRSTRSIRASRLPASRASSSTRRGSGDERRSTRASNPRA